ncbi:homeodomain-like protein [Tanacetum coccineum]
MEESLSKFMAESAKRHDENSNLTKEIRAATDAAIRNQGASIKALEIQIGQMRKVLQERGSGSLPSSTKTNPRDHVKSISTTIETETPLICRIEPVRYAILSHQNIMQIFKPSQSIKPFPNRLIDDSYEEKEVLSGFMDSEKSATYLKRVFMERPRMEYQSEASMNVHDSVILEDSLPPKENDPGSFTIPCYINNICFEKALADLGASVSVMPYSNFTNLGLGELTPTKLIIELAYKTIKRPKGIAENVLLGRPFLSTVHFKIDVFKRKITLKVGDDKIAFKNNNPTNSIIRRVYALGLSERMELDLEARLMGKALILNRSLDLTYGDYIELNDLNEPLELRRNQVEDLGPMIEDGEVIDKPIIEVTKTRNNNEEIEGIDEYPSFCDFDRKMHMDCAYNLQFSFMIGGNVVEAFINVPIFVGNFSVVTDFAVIENMDAYCDEGIGDVIVGKPFCREIYVKAKRFDGMITIYNDNDDVTYQMARSHPRFKHLTNEQCNKMRPLLKVSACDQLSGISHSYQKLKSFYKGVLNLGPEYVRDAKIEEWLTHGHVSMHEMD